MTDQKGKRIMFIHHQRVPSLAQRARGPKLRQALARGVIAMSLLVGMSALGLASLSESSAASSAPIKVMTIGPVNTQLTAYPQIPEAAKLYADAANAAKGVAGHKLDVINCDDEGIPAQAETCAHDAVADKVCAVGGSYSINQGLIIPILLPAHIAYFGTCCAFSPQDLTDKNSFPIGSQTMIGVGIGVAAANACDHIGFVSVGLAPYQAYYHNLESTVVAGEKKTIAVESDPPITATDMTPYVAQ